MNTAKEKRKICQIDRGGEGEEACKGKRKLSA